MPSEYTGLPLRPLMTTVALGLVGVAVTVVSVTVFATVAVYIMVAESKAGSNSPTLSVRLLNVASSMA